MATISDLFKNNRFLALPDSEKVIIMSRVNPRFAGLSDSEKDIIFQQTQSQQTQPQQTQPQQPAPVTSPQIAPVPQQPQQGIQPLDIPQAGEEVNITADQLLGGTAPSPDLAQAQPTAQLPQAPNLGLGQGVPQPQINPIENIISPQSISPTTPQAEPTNIMASVRKLKEELLEAGVEENEDFDTDLMPEIGKMDVGVWNSLRIGAGLLLTSDPVKQVEMIKNILPEAKFFVNKHDEVIVQNQGKSVVLDKRGLSEQDIIQFAGEIAQIIPANTLVGWTKGLWKKMLVGGLAGTATELARDTAASVAGADSLEEGLSNVDLTQAGLAGSIQGASEAIIPGAKLFFGSGAATGFKRMFSAIPDQIGVAASDISHRIVKGAAEHNVPLAIPQMLKSPALRQQLANMQNKINTSRIVMPFIEEQNKAVREAVDTTLDLIAKQKTISRALKGTRKAASDLINTVTNRRTKITEPLYNNAYKVFADKKLEVDLKPFHDFVENQLQDLPFKGSVAKRIKKAADLINTPRKIPGSNIETEIPEDIISSFLGSMQLSPKTIADKITLAKSLNPVKARLSYMEPNLLKLNNSLIEMGGIISKMGNDPIGKQAKRFLTAIKARLEQQVYRVSPELALARRTSSRLAKPLTKLKDKGITAIAELEDKDLGQLAGKIFGTAKTDPGLYTQIARLLQTQDPQSFRSLIRADIQTKISQINWMDDTLDGISVGLPQKYMKAIFGSEQSRVAYMSTLPKDIKQNMTWLQDMLSGASTGRYFGSSTNSNQANQKLISGGAKVIGGIKNMLGNLVSTGTQFADDALMLDREAKLAQILVSSDMAPFMKMIKKVTYPDGVNATAKGMLNAARLIDVKIDNLMDEDIHFENKGNKEVQRIR